MSRGNFQRIQGKSRNKSARKYLTFRLADDTYAINMLYVREITSLQDISPISQVPSYVKGVISKFDEVIPVVDLRERLEVPGPPFGGCPSLIIIEIPQRLKVTCGLLVDSIEEISSIPAAAIDGYARPSYDTMLGIAELDAGPITLLNIYRVLDPEEVPVIENTRALRVV